MCSTSVPSHGRNCQAKWKPVLHVTLRLISNVVSFHSFRWLHAYCDQFTKEEDVERAADAGYKCYYCRPKSHSFFSITSTSTVTSTSRWSQSTVNTVTCMSSYAFGTFGKFT